MAGWGFGTLKKTPAAPALLMGVMFFGACSSSSPATNGLPTTSVAGTIEARTQPPGGPAGEAALSSLRWVQVVPTASDTFGGPGSQFVEVVAGWGDGFVGVGHQYDGTGYESLTWASPDGVRWDRTSTSSVTFADSAMARLAESDGALVAAGEAGGLGQGHGIVALVSSDGRTWTRTDVGTGAERAVLRDLAAGPGGFLLLGLSIDTREPLLWRSTDGTTWQEAAIDFLGPDERLAGIDGWPGGFVALGDSGPPPEIGGPGSQGVAWWSANGVGWHPASVERPPTERPDCFGIGGLIAGADGLLSFARFPCSGAIVISPPYESRDAKAWRWSARSGPPFDRFAEFASDGRRMVALSRDQEGAVEAWSSLDGLTWRTVALAGDEPLWPDDGWYRFGFGAAGIVLTGWAGRGDGAPGDDAGVWVLLDEGR